MYGQPLIPLPGVTDATAGGEGALDVHLAPSSSVASFDELAIYRIGEGALFVYPFIDFV